MKFSSRDSRCRYVPAPGTQTKHSPFGALLKACGVTFPTGLSLERMIGLGWMVPALRVSLPRAAFEAWRDFPQLSLVGAEECPDEDRWALSLYVDAVSTAPPSDKEEWWIHYLDDPEDELNREARAHAIDPTDGSARPEIIRHPRFGQEIRPWIDYLAYWQVYEIADIALSLTASFAITPDLVECVAGAHPALSRFAESKRQSLAHTWNQRRRAFEWVSWVRTVFGASVSRDRSWREIDDALHRVAEAHGLSPEEIRYDIRDTLLVMWQQWTRKSSPLARQHASLLELLRQDIEFAITSVECLTEEPTDFLASDWYYARQPHEWARLIDALPREEELARKDFPDTAMMYLPRYLKDVPPLAAIDVPGLHRLVADNWVHSRPLRRLVLALHRLHEELGGEALMESERRIRKAERIEQFNLTMLHAERVLSFEYRKRCQTTKYPEIRSLAKDTINHLIGKWGFANKGAVSRDAQSAVKRLLQERAMLHELDSDQGLQLVQSEEINSGSEAVDAICAAFINLVIARNYAAHHDAIDDELVYPPGRETEQHPGGIALSSALAAVVMALSVDRESAVNEPS